MSCYVDSETIIKELNCYNETSKCNILGDNKKCAGVCVIEDNKKCGNICVIEDCENNNYVKGNIFSSIDCKNLSQLKKVKNILCYLKGSVKKFITNITILKSKIVTLSNKDMKIYLSEYKQITYQFVKELKHLLSERYCDFYLVNNIFDIYDCKCACKSIKASFRNINNLNCNTIRTIYSIPGFTIQFNTTNYYFRIITNKCKYNFKNRKHSTHKFLFNQMLEIKCNKVSKSKFINMIDSIYDYKSSCKNNIRKFLNFLDLEISELNGLTC